MKKEDEKNLLAKAKKTTKTNIKQNRGSFCQVSRGEKDDSLSKDLILMVEMRSRDLSGLVSDFSDGEEERTKQGEKAFSIKKI